MKIKKEILNNKKMRTAKIIFENGDTLTTCINGSSQVIKEYYLSNYFNVGSYPNEEMQKGKHVFIYDDFSIDKLDAHGTYFLKDNYNNSFVGFFNNKELAEQKLMEIFK